MKKDEYVKIKQSIFGFKQDVMIKLNLDANDIVILRWFVDFKETGSMEKKIADNKIYYWVNYQTVLDTFPYLFTNNTTALGQKKAVQRLFNDRLSCVLEKKIFYSCGEKKGVYTYFTVKEQVFKELISDKVLAKINVPKETPPKKTPPKVPAEELEEIWKLYRNKKGKADAFKKIPIRLKELGKEQLIRCIERYDNYCKKSDYKFMVYGSTFFNGTYLDYTDENYVSDSQKTKDDREEKIRRINEMFKEKENVK